MAIIGDRSSQAQPIPVARLVAPGPSVAMHKPGTPVIRPVTSAAKPAEPSWAVSTNSTPPLRIASISGNTLPLGMPKPRSIPAALRVATIRSALFMGFSIRPTRPFFTLGTVGKGEAATRLLIKIPHHRNTL